MANINSTKFTRPLPMRGDGTAVFIADSATISANPSISDTVSFPVPAGFELHELKFNCPDMDTNGAPTMAAKIGYAPAGGASTLKLDGAAVAADDDYFTAAAAFCQAAGKVDYRFTPIRFDDGGIITVTWTTAAATFAAGTLRSLMAGNQIGAN